MSQRLSHAMLQPVSGPTDIFGVAYLQLCQISYALPSSIPALVKTKMPPLSVNGRWECVWGPVESDDLANLVFVAAYYDGPNLPPTFAAVVTRGTDVDVDDVWGVLQQAFEDFYVIFQRSPPWLPAGSSALVADGTIYALETIQGFSDPTQGSLLDFVANFLQAPENQNPVLVHGPQPRRMRDVGAGALATVLAGAGGRFESDRAGDLRGSDGRQRRLRGLLHIHFRLLPPLLQHAGHRAISLGGSRRDLHDLRRMRHSDSRRSLFAPRRLGGRHVGRGRELFPAKIDERAAAWNLLRAFSCRLVHPGLDAASYRHLHASPWRNLDRYRPKHAGAGSRAAAHLALSPAVADQELR